MSFSFYLYRAAEGLPPINKWTEMHAESLGGQEEVAQALSSLFEDVQWSKSQEAWNGMGPSPIPSYIDIWLHSLADCKVHFIVMNKAAPSAMRRVCEAFGLNYVAAPEAGDLVDIYAYGDNDRFYAKRASVA
jgi:hypothetical protein